MQYLLTIARVNMFEPGYYRFSGVERGDAEALYCVHVRYRKQVSSDYESILCFEVSGKINGYIFSGAFELHRDTAFNFASPLNRLLAKNGIPVSKSLIMRRHQDYDLMFKDIHSLLQLRYGEPIDLDHIGILKL
ncbi:DUF5064 family protein [Pseudomonas syringae group sp. J309-1]|uniref:DUF5064 family protein n=1 Tax=Pseudomonas syringae group sp. J309-1 TaxID=3079588 RepID=UPI003977DFA9